MGEDSWRVHFVGAPGLDSIIGKKFFSGDQLKKKYGLDFSRPVLLVLQHPGTAEAKSAGKHITETMEAVKALGLQSVVIYPNADPGSGKIIKVIKKYRKYPFIRIFKNIPRADYLSLMNAASAMVGNSSSGIIVRFALRKLFNERLIPRHFSALCTLYAASITSLYISSGTGAGNKCSVLPSVYLFS